MRHQREFRAIATEGQKLEDGARGSENCSQIASARVTTQVSKKKARSHREHSGLFVRLEGGSRPLARAAPRGLPTGGEARPGQAWSQAPG
jgi:hypothetical protein